MHEFRFDPIQLPAPAQVLRGDATLAGRYRSAFGRTVPPAGSSSSRRP